MYSGWLWLGATPASSLEKRRLLPYPNSFTDASGDGCTALYDLALNGVCMPQRSIFISMVFFAGHIRTIITTYVCMYLLYMYIRISDSICMYGFDVTTSVVVKGLQRDALS